MATFIVYQTITRFAEIEADSLEEAQDISTDLSDSDFEIQDLEETIEADA
jgi:phage tail sheath protein FI